MKAALNPAVIIDVPKGGTAAATESVCEADCLLVERQGGKKHHRKCNDLTMREEYRRNTE
jgi:hypothetical protein